MAPKRAKSADSLENDTAVSDILDMPALADTLQKWQDAKKQITLIHSVEEACKSKVEAAMMKAGVTSIRAKTLLVEKKMQSRTGVSAKDLPKAIVDQYAKTSTFPVFTIKDADKAAAKGKAKAKAKAKAKEPEPAEEKKEAAPSEAKAKAPVARPPTPPDDDDEDAPAPKDPLDSDDEEKPKEEPEAAEEPPQAAPEEPFVGSHAQKFLAEAHLQYQDRPPPRHPEDAKNPLLSPKSSPKPPAKEAPQPPSPDKKPPGEMKAAALRESQSSPELAATAPAAPETPAATTPAPAPVSRKTYGGTMKDGRFERTKAQEVDHLTETEQKEILADMEAEKAKRMQEIQEKQKLHKERKKKEEAAKAEKQAQMKKAEDEEEERRKKKVKELKKWLKRKEDETRMRKERDAEMLQLVMEKEVQKSEALKKVEEDRLKERERRLHHAEKQKAKLEAQLLLSREAARGMKNMELEPLDQPPVDLQSMEPAAPQPPGRVVHRHIHHHMHYHEGGEGEGGEESPGGPSAEQQRKIEMASEARVRAQLEASGQQAYPGKAGGMMPGPSAGMYPPMYRGLPPVDSGAETPTMHRALSMPSMPPGYGGYGYGAQPMAGPGGMRISRTQEAFRQGPPMGALPPMDLQDMGRRNGLVRYAGSVQRAMGAYGDSGRPRGAYH
mmetsp:Transcript_64678/g.145281  ORF Transcript_64678/g.145281 Transcript_64678/m.145281 type:complete len:666 (+) Transcript_64678:64-2061(+)